MLRGGLQNRTWLSPGTDGTRPILQLPLTRPAEESGNRVYKPLILVPTGRKLFHSLQRLSSHSHVAETEAGGWAWGHPTSSPYTSHGGPVPGVEEEPWVGSRQPCPSCLPS